ncbi:MAG TPA: hypothetical protein PLI06_05020 [Methanofastidiosum sp.]|nr:hypothetical protein [Methanofastidiosum sp.]
MVLQWKPKNQPRKYSFKDFQLADGTIIGVFQGSRGSKPDLDIVVKYKDKYTRNGVRTPKHIHWVIDLLIKKEHDKKLTLEFIEYLNEMYDIIEPFKTKEEQQKCELKYTTSLNLSKFEKLNCYGQYSIEFIGHIIELFSIEEKTGLENAFMFKKVLNAIKEEKDIFSIVSTATHNGRL